jgi:hypothetical protein
MYVRNSSFQDTGCLIKKNAHFQKAQKCLELLVFRMMRYVGRR